MPSPVAGSIISHHRNPRVEFGFGVGEFARMRTVFTALALLVGTVLFGSITLLAELLGRPHGPQSIYAKTPRWWASWLLGAAGVKVVVHDEPFLPEGAPRVFMANHVSWFDIPSMIAALPHYGFVAKRELEKIPFFGPAARAVGVIYIDRENRQAAFSAYEDAASKIRAGHHVLVYPEGTRGFTYALRPFKKGPFVMAIGAGAPIVPVVVGAEARAVALSAALREAGVFVPAIRFPTVARGAARLRFTVSAEHTAEDLATLADALSEIGNA